MIDEDSTAYTLLPSQPRVNLRDEKQSKDALSLNDIKMFSVIVKQSFSSISALKKMLRMYLKNDLFLDHYYKLALKRQESYVFDALLKTNFGLTSTQSIYHVIETLNHVTSLDELYLDNEYLNYFNALIKANKSDPEPYILLLQAFFIAQIPDFQSVDAWKKDNNHKQATYQYEKKFSSLKKLTQYQQEQKIDVPFMDEGGESDLTIQNVADIVINMQQQLNQSTLLIAQLQGILKQLNKVIGSLAQRSVMQKAYVQRALVYQKLANKYPLYSKEHWGHLQQAKANYYAARPSVRSEHDFIYFYQQAKLTQNPQQAIELYTRAITINPYFEEAHQQRLLTFYRLKELMLFHRIHDSFVTVSNAVKPIVDFFKTLSKTQPINTLIKITICNNAQYPLYIKVSEDKLYCNNAFHLHLLLYYGKASIQYLYGEDKVLSNEYSNTEFRQIINDLIKQKQQRRDVFEQYIAYFYDFNLVNNRGWALNQMDWLLTLPQSRVALITDYIKHGDYIKANCHISNALLEYQQLLGLDRKNKHNIQRQIINLRLQRAVIYQKLGYLNCEANEYATIVRDVKNNNYPAIYYRLAIIQQKQGDLQQSANYMNLARRSATKPKMVKKINQWILKKDVSQSNLVDVNDNKYKHAMHVWLEIKEDKLIERVCHKILHEMIKKSFISSQPDSIFNKIMAIETIKDLYETIISLYTKEDGEIWLKLANLALEIDLKVFLMDCKQIFIDSIKNFKEQQKQQQQDLMQEQQRLREKNIEFENTNIYNLLNRLSQKEYIHSSTENYKTLVSILNSNIADKEKISKISDVLIINLSEHEKHYLLANDFMAVVVKALEEATQRVAQHQLYIKGYNIFLSQYYVEIEKILQKNQSITDIIFNGVHLFVDTSLCASVWRGKNVHMKAQVIEFIDNVSMDLSGQPGEKGKSPAAQPKATRVGERGKEGEPGGQGQAGQNGGDLFLFAQQEIRNKKALRALNVSGGKGGLGGNGGDGGDGMAGEDGKNGQTEEPTLGPVSDGYWILSRGTPGYSGGEGGAGGAAGLGGYGGAAGHIVVMEKNVNITSILQSVITNNDYTNEAAADGQPGAGGSGGLGGLNGYDELRVKPGFGRSMQVIKERDIQLVEYNWPLPWVKVPSKWNFDGTADATLRSRTQGKRGERGLTAEQQLTRALQRNKASVKQHQQVAQQQQVIQQALTTQLQQSIEQEQAQNLLAMDSIAATLQTQQNVINMLENVLNTLKENKTEHTVLNQTKQQFVRDLPMSSATFLLPPLTIKPETPSTDNLCAKQLKKTVISFDANALLQERQNVQQTILSKLSKRLNSFLKTPAFFIKNKNAIAMFNYDAIVTEMKTDYFKPHEIESKLVVLDNILSKCFDEDIVDELHKFQQNLIDDVWLEESNHKSYN